MSKKILVQVNKMTELDSYKNGCDPDSTEDFGIVDTFKCDTLKEALEVITAVYGIPGIFEERLLVQRLENEVGDIPSQAHIKRFENGECNLYATSYYCYLSEIETRDIDNEELIKAFPNLEQI